MGESLACAHAVVLIQRGGPQCGSFLLLIYFLLLLGCGIWLITWGAPGSILAVYGTTLVVSIAGLFARKHIFGIAIDRRNHIDLSRAQWLGRRGRSRTQDTRGQ
jgi:hypothetical protein